MEKTNQDSLDIERYELAALGISKRHTFTATLGRWGHRRGWRGRRITTVLFYYVRDEQGNEITDHLWFTAGRWITSLRPQPGDIIRFDARVAEYEKGYIGNEDWDWKLSHPTRAAKVGKQADEISKEHLDDDNSR